MPPLGATDAREENATNLTALALTLRQSRIELMADYGVHVTPQKWRVEPALSSAPLVAEVDFKGRLLYGSVVPSATRGVVLETAQGAAGTDASDVSVDVGVPRPLVTVEPTLDYDLRQRFSCAAGTFSLFLVATFDAGLVLGVGSSDEGLPSEGELLLF